jgi:AcrR family transcriptional regulator
MELTKGEKTKLFIIEQVAPVFNKQGYIGTSLTDITKATGLTKGAIYHNFDNKENLAIEAFNYNIRKAIGSVAQLINAEESVKGKFKALTQYYRDYYISTLDYGGCPILNVGIDSNNINQKLKSRVNQVIRKLQNSFIEIIQLGIQQNEVKKDIKTDQAALKIISIIEGAIYTATMLEDNDHISSMMDLLDGFIEREILI